MFSDVCCFISPITYASTGSEQVGGRETGRGHGFGGSAMIRDCVANLHNGPADPAPLPLELLEVCDDSEAE